MMNMGVDVEIADGQWGKYLDDPPAHGVIERVGNLPRGTASGKPAFQVLARLDDGSQVIVETTWDLMRMALRAMDT